MIRKLNTISLLAIAPFFLTGSIAKGKIIYVDDDAVDTKDLLILVDMWLSENVLLAEDINRDGLVNFADFAMLAENWLWEE